MVLLVMVLHSVSLESVLSLKVQIIIDGWALVHWGNVFDKSDADVILKGVLDLSIGDVSVTVHEHGSVHGVGKLINLLLDGNHLFRLHTLGPVDGDQKGKSSDFLNK